jgi:hypothetical protein
VPSDKPRLPVILEKQDYEWIEKESERAGISKGGVVRQAVKLYQETGGLLGSARMKRAEQVYADEQRGSTESTESTEHE